MNVLAAEWFPLGTFINGICIIVGGLAGLWLRRQLSSGIQLKFRYFLVVLTFAAGGGMIWKGAMEGDSGMGLFLARFGIVFVALILGALTGRFLGLQRRLDRLGAYAREQLSKSNDDCKGISEGFVTCTILFCVGPMSLVGPIEDGLGRGVPLALLAKSAMDGVATLAMTPRYGWGPILAVVPVVSLQGTITLLAQTFSPIKDNPELLASVSLAGGMMVLTIVLVILEVRKVPLADYLPALVLAPLLAHWCL
ncbi:MAG: hypothetical protein CMO74_01665 [Verrucomicrobiales bacterium]|nr:hypothetical protein [Verrucomicrobiales bacterium]|tara:strand:+ start:6523 stop:7278 length:756 start_codon:yes stop_codon:yes gene_type:complete